MTLLVRDEEDILESHLRYHLSRGVDQILVTDNLSQDSTPEILDRFEKTGRCTVFRESADDFSQWKWVTRMSRIAAIEFGADWVIHSDADEFWWSAGDSFAQALARVPPEVGIVEVQRFDFLPRRESEGSFFDRMIYRDLLCLNSLGRPLPPNIVHRAHPEATVEQGNHVVEAPGLESGPGHEPFCVFHFPLRTRDQFTHKIVVGGRAYERNNELHPSVGDVRRWLYGLYKEGGLDRYWEEQVVDVEELERRQREGAVELDVRLRDYMRGLVGDS